MLSRKYWLHPGASPAGVFPHVCLGSTIILGLVTRAWSAALLIICAQGITLLIFFNNTLVLKSRLVSVSELVTRTINARTAATQEAVNKINAARHKLTTKAIDLDGDGKADIQCFFGSTENVVNATRSPELQALDAQHAQAFAEHRAATAAAMTEVAAILAQLECVTEADVRADFASLAAQKAHLRAALRGRPRRWARRSARGAGGCCASPLASATPPRASGCPRPGCWAASRWRPPPTRARTGGCRASSRGASAKSCGRAPS